MERWTPAVDQNSRRVSQSISAIVLKQAATSKPHTPCSKLVHLPEREPINMLIITKLLTHVNHFKAASSLTSSTVSKLSPDHFFLTEAVVTTQVHRRWLMISCLEAFPEWGNHLYRNHLYRNHLCRNHLCRNHLYSGSSNPTKLGKAMSIHINLFWKTINPLFPPLSLSFRFEVVHILSQASNSWNGLKGRVNATTLKTYLPCAPCHSERDKTLVCICGPNPFTAGVSK